MGIAAILTTKPDTLPFTLVPYDPTVHGAFVRDSWAKSALQDGSRSARARLDAILSLPGSVAIVAHVRGNPDLFAGWAARTESALVFAYVKPAARGRALGRAMVRALDLDPSRPLPLLHWTPSAQQLAARGVPVFHALYPIAA